MANFSGPYSRKVEYLDKIADILRGEDDLIHNVGDREIFALQRLAEFIEGEGSGKYKNVQSDWNAEPDSQAAILNKPDGIPVDPNYVHTDENFTAQHRNKLENIRIAAAKMNGTTIHPREVFSEPLKLRATAVILAPNHPSGNLEPSPDDLEVTYRIRKAGLLLGIAVLDHIIFNTEGYLSMMESGELL